MKAFGLIVILIGSFSAPAVSGLVAIAAGAGIIAIEYMYG